MEPSLNGPKHVGQIVQLLFGVPSFIPTRKRRKDIAMPAKFTAEQYETRVRMILRHVYEFRILLGYIVALVFNDGVPMPHEVLQIPRTGLSLILSGGNLAQTERA